MTGCWPGFPAFGLVSANTAVESPTLATKMWFCLKMTVDAVVPAVLRSPILLVFHVTTNRWRGGWGGEEKGGKREGVGREERGRREGSGGRDGETDRGGEGGGEEQEVLKQRC